MMFIKNSNLFSGDINLTDTISSNEIQIALFRELDKRQFKFINPNIYINNWFECDIFAINNSGYGCEFEIKISRSDFKRDYKKLLYGCKSKHDILSNKENPKEISKFIFVCPYGMIQPDEINENYGLYYVSKFMRAGKILFDVVNVKSGKLLSKHKLTDSEKIDILKSTYYKIWNEKTKVFKQDITEQELKMGV